MKLWKILVIILVGIVGLVLPIIPGIVFIVFGLIELKKYFIKRKEDEEIRRIKFEEEMLFKYDKQI
jgi:uncharacterized protein YqgC (DUF456 family)